MTECIFADVFCSTKAVLQIVVPLELRPPRIIRRSFTTTSDFCSSFLDHVPTPGVSPMVCVDWTRANVRASWYGKRFGLYEDEGVLHHSLPACDLRLWSIN